MVLVYPLGTIPDRAWFAYQCLPRQAPKNGRSAKRGALAGLPTSRELAREHGLSPAVFSRLFNGERHGVSSEIAPKLAAALRVSIDWLLSRNGETPTLTGPYQPRESAFIQHDPESWARQYAENPTRMIPGKHDVFANPLEEAVHDFRRRHPELAALAVVEAWLADLRNAAASRERGEWDFTGLEWLQRIEQEVPRPKSKKRKKEEPVPAPPAVAPPAPRKKRRASAA